MAPPSAGVSSGILNEDLSVPQEWTEVGEVSKLCIYPVKSATGHYVDTAKAEKHGLRCDSRVDRQFMVVDKTGKFVTARRYPHLVLLESKIEDGTLKLSAPEMKDVVVRLPKETAKKETVDSVVWGKAVPGISLGPEASEWISQFIIKDPNAGFQVIYHLEDDSKRERQDEGKDITPRVKGEDIPYYADGFPYLLCAEESFDDLKQRLDEDPKVDPKLTVDERRFRPNIVVKDTSGPFAEDTWLYVRINDCLFRNVKLCTRCQLPAVDPETGVPHPQGEPTKTLKTYRSSLNPRERKSYGTSPFFGINLAVDRTGIINVGDKVFIGKG